MAHDRVRQVDDLYGKLIAFTPIIGVFGHRQVGKTTYTSKSAGSYVTLDDLKTRQRVEQDPSAFIREQHRKPLVIDECQNAPELFPALKEFVRTHKKPGQFILTGSVRFTSRKAIRESLAGRMTTLELYPLILSELMQVELPDVVPNLLAAREFSESSTEALLGATKTLSVQKHLETYLERGGLPGLCFVRNRRQRQELLSSLHALILDRDLRMIVQTKLSLNTLSDWLRWIAARGWQPYSASEVKRTFGLAHKTQENLLFALESVFMIRRIPLRGRTGTILLLEDQFEEFELSDGVHSLENQTLSALYRNCRAQFQYRLGDTARFESYWTRSGARVPLVIKSEAKTLGFICIPGDTPTLSQRRAADSFLRNEPTGKVIFVSARPIRAKIMEPRVMKCSAASLL